MNLRRLKWLAILAPMVFIGVLEYARYALAPLLDSWQGHLLMDAVVLAGAIFFYGAVFTVVDHMQRALAEQNRELAALRRAGLDISSELSLDAVLEKVVSQACRLIGTRYGALSVIDEQGAIQSFVTAGVDAAEAAPIGPPPVGRGLLGVVLRQGQHLRIDDITRDPRSCGFPPGHPLMRSLLAVPVVCRSPCRGNLYLSQKLDGSAFTGDEQDTLERFAVQAASAVDNAFLHAQAGSLAVAEERLRLAREMHDSQAQVLAFVNAKAQAVRELLRGGRGAEAEAQLEQLAAAAREVYADVREGILGLRSVTDGEHGFSEVLHSHLERWRDQSGVALEVEVDPVPGFAADIELQLLRIVQESLANVRKHAGAGKARVALRAAGEGIEVTVEDDGVGFDPEALGRSRRPRFGLATMRERAEAIGARLRIDSARGRGTRITLAFPAPGRRPREHATDIGLRIADPGEAQVASENHEVNR